MSAIDWTPGPRLRALKAKDGAFIHMEFHCSGMFKLLVQFKDRAWVEMAETAQEAADSMERLITGV